MFRVNVSGHPENVSQTRSCWHARRTNCVKDTSLLESYRKKNRFFNVSPRGWGARKRWNSSVRRPLPLTSGCHKSARAGAVLSRTVCWEASRLRARAGFLSIRGACGGGGGSGRAESVQSCTQLHTHQPRICSPAAVKPQPLTWQSASGRASAI